MAEAPKASTQLKPIPALIINEGSPFGPLNFNNFIHPPAAASDKLRFSVQLVDGKSFPSGLSCTPSGMISGTADVGTAGEYEAELTVVDESGNSLSAKFPLTINSSMAVDDPYFLTDLKSQVWEALGQDLPIPEIGSILNRPITPVEIYYLLQRFAVLTIWDVYNLESPGEKHLLKLDGMNPHYNAYDRGSCLVVAPKDLYSHKRTLADALQASKVLAQEVYKRGWTIEFAGFNKMVRAAWVELQHLGDKHGKKIEILHFSPTPDDLRVYVVQTQMRGPTPG